jgi:putative membrane protein
MACGTVASAHEEDVHGWTAPGALSAWDLAALAALTAVGALYLHGWERLRRRGVVLPVRERAAFATGWSVLAVAMLPPLDALAVESFSVHMVQHELMMLVGAPLVIAGRPLAACVWGLPDGWRVHAGALLSARPARAAWRAVSAPATAWALHGLAIWVWHVPELYTAAVRHEAAHAVQHASFVASAALFWFGLVYGRYGRAGYGAAVFYVFTTVVHTGLLGAILTLARVPLYRVYVEPAAARGVDVLADQQLAGLLMWIPAGTVLTLFGIALFAAWIGEAERRQRVLTK